MYVPKQFAEHESDQILQIVRDHALGALITNLQSGLQANHIPFLIDPSDASGKTLRAHVARANSVWKDATDGDEVMVIFQGPQGYISPNWYPSKAETHRRVPTWNYEVVHAHGKIYVHDDEKFLRGSLARLTRQHESTQPSPWKMGDAPADFLSEELKHIVGIEIRVERYDCKRKLNQHHEARDREGAIRGLGEQGNPDLAQAMKSAGPQPN